jgi:hypothetical protein
MPKRDIPSKWLKPTNYTVDRFERVDLVVQLAEQGFAVSSTENTERTESPRRDLNARPKVYETFALPAELLGQNKCKFSSSIFNGSR